VSAKDLRTARFPSVKRRVAKGLTLTLLVTVAAMRRANAAEARADRAISGFGFQACGLTV
jgi:hypothetical protein